MGGRADLMQTILHLVFIRDHRKDTSGGKKAGRERGQRKEERVVGSDDNSQHCSIIIREYWETGQMEWR